MQIVNVHAKHDMLNWFPSTSIRNPYGDDDVNMFLIQGNFVKIQSVLKIKKRYVGSNFGQFCWWILNIHANYDMLKWSPSTSIRNPDGDDDVNMFLIQGNFVKIQQILKLEKRYVGSNFEQ